MYRDDELEMGTQETELTSLSGFSATALDPGYQNIRERVGYINTNETGSILEVSGDGAAEFLDRVLPGRLTYLQPLCSLMTPVLDENIRLIDMIYVINREDRFQLLITRDAKAAVTDFLSTEAKAFPDVQIQDKDEALSSILIEGPYSWKVAKAIAGPEVTGLRVLYAMEFDLCETKGLCLRSGITGEYGYRFIVNRTEYGALLEALDAVPEFSAMPITSEELRVLCHETRMPAFGITLRSGDCPFEMGVRYTLDFRKESYLYYERLIQRRDEVSRGLVGFQTEGATLPWQNSKAGEPVYVNGCAVGELRYSGVSPTTGKGFGFAFLPIDIAFPGLKGIGPSDQSIAKAVTSSTPFFETKSMEVSVE